MGHVIQITNPFDPSKDVQQFEVKGAPTIREWLKEKFPGFTEFDRPTICWFNGKPLLRKDWESTKIDDDSIVAFAAVPGNPVVVLYVLYIILVVASIIIAANIKKPTAPIQANQDSLQGDPVYTLKGQRNQIRLGDVIEVPYGRCRIWPSYAAVPYNKYQNNDQWLYQLFNIGQGQYQIEDADRFIEDTPISNFQDVEIEIIPPGGSVTLFPNNVVTSPEISNTELFGTNQPESGHVYVIDVEEEGHWEQDEGGGGSHWVVDVEEQGHWEYSPVGPFVVNPTGTVCNRLEIDVTCPKGLYFTNNNGGLDGISISATFDARKIDDAGAPLGDWFSLVSIAKHLATATPQRFTIGADVPEGRYEVRGYRNNGKNLSNRAANDLYWEGLRAYLPNTHDYGDCTLMAVKARATNNLNSNAQTRFNVFATRKLPIWNKVTQTWTAPAATRSLVWAFCDVFRSKYGGVLPDKFLSLDELYDLDAVYTSRQEFFDWIFDSQVTAWEAARLIARAGRAVPMLVGSRITLIRDEPKSLPTAIFNQDNIVEGSFKWEIKLKSVDSNDGLEVTYIDPDTWKEETVMCLLDGQEGDNPKRTKYQGITGRDHAARLGMYDWSMSRYVRENIIFKTGMEGHIPTFGDLIMVAHDIPRWATGGRVLAVNGLNLTLSEKVTFEVGQTHKIILRKKNGSSTLPLNVSAGTDEFHVVLSEPLTGSDFDLADKNERPIYLFGKTSMWGKPCRVINLAPAEDDTVEITAANYSEIPFTFDEYDAPALDNNDVGLPSIPALPSVTGLTVVKSPNMPNQVQASWLSAAGAQYYIVQKSYDNANWEFAARPTQPTATFDVLPQYLYVRVAAVNLGQGAWSPTWQGQSPTDVSVTPVDDGITPNNVTALSFIPKPSTVEIGWTWPNNTIPKYLHIYISTTGVRPANVTFSIPYPATAFVAPGLLENTTYNFWFAVEGQNLRTSAIAGPSSSTTTSDPTRLAMNEFARTMAGVLTSASDRAAELLQEIEDREYSFAELDNALDTKASIAQLNEEAVARQTADASETSARQTAVSTLTTSIDAVGAGLLQEQNTRATADTAEANTRATAVASLQSQVDGKASNAALDSETSARTTADAAEASARQTAIASLQNQVDQKASLAALDAEISARTTADSAEAGARQTAIANLQTQVDGKASTASLNDEINARATADSAEASARQTADASLTTAVGQKASQAALDSEISARTTADSAESSARQSAVASLQTQIDTKASTAYVDSQISARVTELGALARTVATLMVSMNEASAYVQILSSAYVDADGNARAQWGFNLDANGVVTSMEAVAQGGPNPVSEIVFQADLRSKNFVTATTGWKIFGDAGSAEFAGTFKVGNSTNYLHFIGSTFEIKAGLTVINQNGVTSSLYAPTGQAYGRTQIILPNGAVTSEPPYTWSIDPGEFRVDWRSHDGTTYGEASYGLLTSIYYNNGTQSRTLYMGPFNGIYSVRFPSTTAVYDWGLWDDKLMIGDKKIVGVRQAAIGDTSDLNGETDHTNAINLILAAMRAHGLIET